MKNRQETSGDQNGDNQKAGTAQPSSPQIGLPPVVTVKQLADQISVSGIEIIKQLMRNGVMANINQSLEFDVAARIAADF